MLETTALACTVQPMPKAQTAASRAKMTPSHFILRPRSSAYMAPPIMVPSSDLTRYLTEMMVSAYLVAMPKMPVSHIHRTAPGPPMAMAVPTPMMLPVPMVEDSAVVSAPNCDTSPSASGSFLTDSLMALKMSFWINPVRTVMNRCVPNSRMISGHPHKKPSILLMISAKLILSSPLRPPAAPVQETRQKTIQTV